MVDAAIDEDLATTLVQLADADDARAMLRDVVDVHQRVMLSVLAPKDDSAAAMDLHLRAIAELHGACHATIQLRECLPRIGHVFTGTEV